MEFFRQNPCGTKPITTFVISNHLWTCSNNTLHNHATLVFPCFHGKMRTLCFRPDINWDCYRPRRKCARRYRPTITIVVPAERKNVERTAKKHTQNNTHKQQPKQNNNQNRTTTKTEQTQSNQPWRMRMLELCGSTLLNMS